VDLVLRHEARADQVADEVGEPLPLTLAITRPQFACEPAPKLMAAALVNGSVRQIRG
jgi:hypothetical protein